MCEKSLPFGDTLNRENRWIRLAGLIDWHRFESIYAQTFSTTGRPGIRARYVLGSLILKHKLEVSDEELLLQICENPYLQYFIDLEKFSQDITFDAIYGTRKNRQYLDELGIRYTFKPLGRPKKGAAADNQTRWRRQKLKERNRIEGAIGNSKSHYDLGRVRARTDKTEKAWIQMALLNCKRTKKTQIKQTQK